MARALHHGICQSFAQRSPIKSILSSDRRQSSVVMTHIRNGDWTFGGPLNYCSFIRSHNAKEPVWHPISYSSISTRRRVLPRLLGHATSATSIRRVTHRFARPLRRCLAGFMSVGELKRSSSNVTGAGFTSSEARYGGTPIPNIGDHGHRSAARSQRMRFAS